MIIDGHAHACGVYLTKDSIENYLLKHKIDMVVLSGGEPKIKLHQCWSNFDIASKNCFEIFSWVSLKNIPVFIHIISHEQVMKFAAIANQFSNTTFIVAHMIGIDYLKDRLQHNNVYFDLSAPQLYSLNTLKESINYFGANRFILGSDTPYGINNLEKVLSRLKKISLSEKDISNISGNTLASLLSL